MIGSDYNIYVKFVIETICAVFVGDSNPLAFMFQSDVEVFL
jgi:hypothetical protein